MRKPISVVAVLIAALPSFVAAQTVVTTGSVSGRVIDASREETGLQIRITGLIGTYSDPHILIAYSDGEVRQEFTLVYAAEIEGGELKIDDESKEAAWVARSSAVTLPLADSQRRRLLDVKDYQQQGKTFLR